MGPTQRRHTERTVAVQIYHQDQFSVHSNLVVELTSMVADLQLDIFVKVTAVHSQFSKKNYYCLFLKRDGKVERKMNYN